jgi:prepilin-type N-terminal cleavage/methylation domain-containing protein/prepilin-type processing-associated H-X9-DG protein
MLPAGKRPAFTLVELLVVVAIVALLSALLAGAVQKVREAVGRVSCANNLRQVGLALHQYHEANRRFPPGRQAPLPRIFSAHAELLPYLEQEGLYRLIDFSAPPATFTDGAGVVYDGAANFPAASRRVPAFTCPRDSAAGLIPGSPYGTTNYAANAGSGTVAYGSLSVGDGVFFLGGPVRITDVTDGTSNTAAFAERLLGSGQAVDSPAGPAVQRQMLQIPGGDDTTPAACADPGGGVWNAQGGAKWIVGNYGNSLYNHYYPPNVDTWDCLNTQQQKALGTARSAHPGGVNVLLCDGSTHFIANGVAPDVWRALATRAGADGVAGW